MESSLETGRRPAVKECLGSWKVSGNSTHVVRHGHQRTLQSVEDTSDPGLDWVAQDWNAPKRLKGPPVQRCIPCLSRDRLQYLEGASETEGHPKARRVAGNLKEIE